MDIDDLLKQMFAYIMTKVEHPVLPKSGFTLDSIMHIDIDFHKLVLRQGSSYIPLLGWIANKKPVINPNNEGDDKYFKWAVIAALHHAEIAKDPQRISHVEVFKNHSN